MDKEQPITMGESNEKESSPEPKKSLVIEEKQVLPQRQVTALKDSPKTHLRNKQSLTKRYNLVALLSARSRSLPANLPSYTTKNVRFKDDDESNIIVKHNNSSNNNNNKPPANNKLRKGQQPQQQQQDRNVNKLKKPRSAVPIDDENQEQKHQQRQPQQEKEHELMLMESGREEEIEIELEEEEEEEEEVFVEPEQRLSDEGPKSKKKHHHQQALQFGRNLSKLMNNRKCNTKKKEQNKIKK
jgi:hypothetical protein